MRLLFISSIILLCSATSFLGTKADYYKTALEQIKLAVKSQNSPYHHASYDRLAFIVDTYGPRLWGSESQALAVNELFSQIEDLKFDKAYKEPLENINTWKRGEEWLTLYSPRPFPQKLNVIGLGLGASGDVRAEVIVVGSFDELDSVASQVKGKIVCFNVPWVKYGVTVAYRSGGPSKVQKYGGVGMLLRSVTPFSIDSPHTGTTHYDSSLPLIPAAAISVEDAEMFQRMFDRGQKIEVHLHIESEWYKSRTDNIIAEIQGSERPEEILLLGGHFDSWDVGSQTGANDDGGGVMVCLEVLRVLKDLGLRPKRTIRFIAWSGEEMSLPDSGAHQYAVIHQNEHHVLAFESDLGTTKPYGFGFTGSDKATQIVQEIASKYLSDIKCAYIRPNDGDMTDTDPLGDQGIPMMRNLVTDDDTNDFYFTYHHSAGDSMTMMNADDMDDNVVAIASIFFLLADADETLPRN